MYFKFLEEQPKSSEKLILKTDSEIGKSSEVVYGRFLIFLTVSILFYGQVVAILWLLFIDPYNTEIECVFIAQPHQHLKSDVQKSFCNGKLEVHLSPFVGMVFQ